MSARAGTLAPETNAVLGHVAALLKRRETRDEVRSHAVTLSVPADEFSRESTMTAVSSAKRWIAASKPECVMF
jgi:hypothetical protein